MSTGNVNYELEASLTGIGLRKVSQIVEYGDFTDDGSDANGDLTLTKSVPAGSFIIGSKVTVKTGFTGDTSAALKIGSSADNANYSGNTTHNVLAAANDLVKAAFISSDAGLGAVGSDQIIYLTLAGNADFTSISAGRMLVEVFYFSTNVELTDGGRNKSDL